MELIDLKLPTSQNKSSKLNQNYLHGYIQPENKQNILPKTKQNKKKVNFLAFIRSLHHISLSPSVDEVRSDNSSCKPFILVLVSEVKMKLHSQNMSFVIWVYWPFNRDGSHFITMIKTLFTLLKQMYNIL